MAAQQTFAFFRADDSAKKSKASRKWADRKPTPKISITPDNPTTKKPDSQERKTDDSAIKEVVHSNVIDRQSVLKKLRVQVGCMSTASPTPQQLLSTGCQSLDSMLPNNGIRVDALTEWVASSDSSAAAVLSMLAAANHLIGNTDNPNLGNPAATGPLVVVDTQHNFYPPAATALNIPADRIFVVRPNSNADAVWAIDQALRCDAVGAVWAHIGSWLDDRDARRFQLAAETGKTPGLFVRPKRVRGKPSFADIRFFVQPIGIQNRQVSNSSFAAQITIDRCRGGTVGNQISIQINDQGRIAPLSTDDSIQHVPAARNTATRNVVAQNAVARTEAAVMHLAEQLAHSASKDSSASQDSSASKDNAAATKHIA